MEAFLEEIGRSVGRPAAGISQEVKDKLVAYPWPGNVRELRNAIERAVILCEGGLITSEHLPLGVASASRARSGRSRRRSAVQRRRDPGRRGARDDRRRASSRAGNNKSEAARLLGLSRAQLYSRLDKHGLGER